MVFSHTSSEIFIDCIEPLNNMGIKEDISDKIEEMMRSSYEVTDSNKIPDRDSLTFSNTAKKVWARVLFIDLRKSRELLSENTTLISAKTHKSFLYLVTKCIRNRNGEIRSFNGDSILAFFYGEGDEVAKDAVKAAMNIKSAIYNDLNPVLKEKTGNKLDYGIGISQGEIFVVKSGIGGDENYQDLVWIGWPTYLAFEYGNNAENPKNIFITDNVFESIKDDDAFRYHNGEPMWSYGFIETSIGRKKYFLTSYMSGL